MHYHGCCKCRYYNPNRLRNYITFQDLQGTAGYQVKINWAYSFLCQKSAIIDQKSGGPGFFDSRCTRGQTSLSGVERRAEYRLRPNATTKFDAADSSSSSSLVKRRH